MMKNAATEPETFEVGIAGITVIPLWRISCPQTSGWAHHLITELSSGDSCCLNNIV